MKQLGYLLYGHEFQQCVSPDATTIVIDKTKLSKNEMLIEFAECVACMILSEEPETMKHKQIIENLCKVLLMSGMIPNKAIWSKISLAMPNALKYIDMDVVQQLIAQYLMKPLARDCDVSLKNDAIVSLSTWLTQETRDIAAIFDDILMSVLFRFGPNDMKNPEYIVNIVEMMKHVTKAEIGPLIQFAIEIDDYCYHEDIYVILFEIIKQDGWL